MNFFTALIAFNLKIPQTFDQKLMMTTKIKHKQRSIPKFQKYSILVFWITCIFEENPNIFLQVIN